MRFARSVVVLVGVVSASCSATMTLSGQLGPGEPAQSTSSFSPRLHRFQRVMVLPPSGTARGAFERPLSRFEKEFLDGGIVVVSPAITGRVVRSAGKDETAQGLSDAERALLLARDSGVDVILQVGSLEPSGSAERFLCGDSPDHLADCDADRYGKAPWKMVLRGPVLRFTGRLIEVQSGEVLAALSVSQAAVNHASLDLSTVPSYGGLFPNPNSDRPQIVFDCGLPPAGFRDICDEMRAEAATEIVSLVVSEIRQRMNAAPVEAR